MVLLEVLGVLSESSSLAGSSYSAKYAMAIEHLPIFLCKP